MDHAGCLLGGLRTYHALWGVDITNVWRFKLSSLNEHAPNYVPASEYLFGTRRPAGVDGPDTPLSDGRRGLCHYRLPVFEIGNSWWGLRPLDGNLLLLHRSKVSGTPCYTRVLRRLPHQRYRRQSITPAGGCAQPDRHHPNDGRHLLPRRVAKGGVSLWDNSTQEELKIAAVCPCPCNEYQREPCYYHVLKGATFNDL